ncbi:hypothetical protein LXL04_013052 [Taraxacum kok-saghyz]
MVSPKDEYKRAICWGCGELCLIDLYKSLEHWQQDKFHGFMRAYSIYRSSVQSLLEIDDFKDVDVELPAKATSATGSGFEILFQGFNWESNKSGRWYIELQEKIDELAALGFTVVWLPPPTESISPEGYMPRDLYNLNSRYGNVEELQAFVKKFHQAGIRVLGDAVINHR